MIGVDIVPMIIKPAIESNVWTVNINIGPGHDCTAVGVADTTGQGGHCRHRNPNFDAPKVDGYFVHNEFPLMEELKLCVCPLNLTNRSLIAQRNIFAARSDPQI
jgi:hypothetical protein